MKIYQYILLTILIALLILGCNSDKQEQREGNHTYQEVTVVYEGQREGCLVYYDELFCPKEWEPTVLNASWGSKAYVEYNNTLVEYNSTIHKGLQRYIKIRRDK